jgi:hypothetical protein
VAASPRVLVRALVVSTLLFASTACGITDPLSEDLVVSGKVTDVAGVGLTGASVSLVRESCLSGACTTRTRGQDMTDANGDFRIVVVRDADERDLWELVCHEFTIDIEAAGYTPVVGNYQGWRAAFCASGEVAGLEFALTPSG